MHGLVVGNGWRWHLLAIVEWARSSCATTSLSLLLLSTSRPNNGRGRRATGSALHWCCLCGNCKLGKTGGLKYKLRKLSRKNTIWRCHHVEVLRMGCLGRRRYLTKRVAPGVGGWHCGVGVAPWLASICAVVVLLMVNCHLLNKNIKKIFQKNLKCVCQSADSLRMRSRRLKALRRQQGKWRRGGVNCGI